jgi:hypothetical protein
MLCKCGNETETRIGTLGIGFIHGCWNEAHTELLEITDESLTGHVVERIYDLFPITGDEKETEKQAIESYREWAK